MNSVSATTWRTAEGKWVGTGETGEGEKGYTYLEP